MNRFHLKEDNRLPNLSVGSLLILHIELKVLTHRTMINKKHFHNGMTILNGYYDIYQTP